MSTQETSAGDKLDAGVYKVAAVVVLGAIMAILDTTVVNVALQTLTIQFKTSFDTIQWVATGYMLALATVIPITGWASDRFGTKRLYLIAIGLFLAGSMLAGLSWNVGSLIGFRVLQGFGGGMLMPAGMTILTRAAGPQRVGRVMAVLGVPMLLGPIGGPILGGWLVDAVSWRWIFYINVPLGVITILLAARLLPKDDPEPSERFDFVGMLMVSPGLAALIYGVSNIPSAGGVGSVKVWLPALAGLALLIAFVLRALKIPNPLVDLKLFRNRTFSVSMITMTLFCVAFFGAMLLLPTYFLLVRGETALHAGLLLAPQGVGAMLTMPLAGRLADRIGVRRIVLPGMLALIAGLAEFTRVTASTPYFELLTALFVMGLGMGATMMPITTAALQALTSQDMARASTATNIVQQTAGAIGAAVMSIILAALLAGKFDVPTNQGQLAATFAMKNPATAEAASGLAADSFATTFLWATILLALCLIPAFFLPNRNPAASSPTDELAPPATLVH
jgi:EmrB/QacA subfamily drug resistance transporter